jgi:hypothetical protein
MDCALISDSIVKQLLTMSSPGSTGRSSIPETAVIEPKGRGVLDAPHEAGHDSGAHCFAVSRRDASEVCIRSSLKKEGAGKAGCRLAPMAPCAIEEHRGRNHRCGRSSGLPCAMVLRLIRDLPGDQALLSPSSADRSTDLAPALGRQDHTTSPSASCHSSRDIPRPSHPAAHVRDDRDTSLLWLRDRREHGFDLPDNATVGTCDRLARRAVGA